jgi:hypothetical protein
MLYDPTFRDIDASNHVYDADIIISKDKQDLDRWRIKTTAGPVDCYAHRTDIGLKLEARFNELGYIYVRQIASNIRRFEGKTFKLTVELDRTSWQPIDFDVYITSRYSSDDENRITVVDTPTHPLVRYYNKIEMVFDVPVDHSRPTDELNGLSIAFRLIGAMENTDTTIQYMNIEEITEDGC